jgi:hypothetical protein
VPIWLTSATLAGDLPGGVDGPAISPRPQVYSGGNHGPGRGQAGEAVPRKADFVTAGVGRCGEYRRGRSGGGGHRAVIADRRDGQQREQYRRQE